MAGPLKPVPDPDPDPEPGARDPVGTAGEPGSPAAELLAERRARRAELAEQELRERLGASEARVAELELAAGEAERARAELRALRSRDAGIASLVGEAADAVAAARVAVDREIHARRAAETALAAERIARQAAEQAVQAERAARDAANEALVAARVREIPVPGPLPPGAGVPPAIDPALTGAGSRPDEELAAGIAAAADRLRAAAPEATPPGAPDSAAESPPAVRRGGLVGWLESTLRGRR